MEKQLKVYKSSAGSGKTFTLVKEYLKLCLKVESDFSFAAILAITFTNKATYEMKERLMDTLKELSAGQGGVMNNLLLDETGLSAEELKHRANRLLSAILHNYADFSISTIDKFSHRIIRTFAKDLNIAMNFQVELEEKRLLEEVIAEMLNEVGKNKVLSDLIIAFTMQKLDEEKSWNVEDELLSFSSNLLKEEAMPFLKRLRILTINDFKKLEQKFRKENLLISNKLTEIANAGLDLIKDNNIDPKAFAGNSKISIYFKNVADLNHEKIFPTKQLSSNIEKESWYLKTCTADQKAAIESIKGKLEKFYNEIQQLLEEHWPKYLSRAEVLKNSYSLALINQIEKRFSTLKQENAILNIADFNRIIAEEVLNEPMPFIYERLGERYRHIMIDEFQDTSVLQFLNLLPLIDESLAKGHENLLVGDAKQAIYRFRGGEVDQFSLMPDYVPELAEDNELSLQRLHTLKTQFNPNYLVDNYRSSAAIVNFNNAFFHFISNLDISEKLNAIYMDHQQNIINTEIEGYVGISFSKGKAEELEETFGDLTIQSIQQCKEKGYRLNDIAILCRKRKEAAAIATRLKKEKIPVISSEALLLKKSSTVQFIMHLLMWLAEPKADEHKKAIVEYLSLSGRLGRSLEENFEHYLSKDFNFNELFQSFQKSFSVEQLKSLSILELVEYFIRLFSLNESYDVYLQSLQDVALDFTKTQGSDIVQFLNWWKEREGVFSVTIPDNIDAVSILTIHKSKGLEFPVVIYPYAKQEITHSGLLKDYIWVDLENLDALNVPFALVEFSKNLSESSLKKYYEAELEKKEVDLINDTYVAFTRAAEALFIHAESPPKNAASTLKLASLLDQFLSQSSDFRFDEEVYELGELRASVQKKEQTKLDNSIELSYPSFAWKDRLKISAEHIHIELEGEKAPQQYGDLLHELLAQIDNSNELEPVLKQYHLNGIINTKEQELIQHKLVTLLDKPEVSRFFDANYKSRREAALFTSAGNLIRPDRVVYFEGEIAVVDFKTGAKNEKHQEQVLNYCHAIASTTALPVKGYLLYTELEKLEEVA